MTNIKMIYNILSITLYLTLTITSYKQLNITVGISSMIYVRLSLTSAIVSYKLVNDSCLTITQWDILDYFARQ